VTDETSPRHGKLIAKIVPASPLPSKPFFANLRLRTVFLRSASTFTAERMRPARSVRNVTAKSGDLLRYRLSGTPLLSGAGRGCRSCFGRHRSCGKRCPWSSREDRCLPSQIAGEGYSSHGLCCPHRPGSGAHRTRGIHWLPQDDDILSLIRKVYENLPPTVFLRAADAIHLASAAKSGFRFVYSNDAHLLAGAKYFGLEAKNVI